MEIGSSGVPLKPCPRYQEDPASQDLEMLRLKNLEFLTRFKNY
ncbi:MAG: hypothetical protein ACJAUV_000506 [Flavobacteriales bacterium]|jgi:hypothetical protein